MSFATDLPALDYFTTCTCTTCGVFSNPDTLANEKYVHVQQLCARLHRPYGHAFLRIRAARQSTHIYPGCEEKDWLYVPLSSVLSISLTIHHKLDRLLTILLILSAFSMGLIAAVGAYIFTAYTLGKPAHAPFASFLGGVVTFLVGWFCLSLVDDVYDLPFPVSPQSLICVLALIHCTCVIASTLTVELCTRQRCSMPYVLVPTSTHHYSHGFTV